MKGNLGDGSVKERIRSLILCVCIMRRVSVCWNVLYRVDLFHPCMCRWGNVHCTCFVTEDCAGDLCISALLGVSFTNFSLTCMSHLLEGC